MRACEDYFEILNTGVGGVSTIAVKLTAIVLSSIVAQARQEKVHCNSESSNGRSKKAKTVWIIEQLSTNRWL